VALAGPLVIGSAVKIAYDLMLYAWFRHLKAPEEQQVQSSDEEALDA
jgi:hypothetical protein